MLVESPCQDFKTVVNLATLPCGGCPYCARAQAQWSKFMTDVDDVVPLASKRCRGVTVATVGSDVVIVPDNLDCSIRVVQEGLGVVLGKYSVDQIREGQGRDPDFGWLLNWLDDNDYQPAEGELFRSSTHAKLHWTGRERFSRDERGLVMYHAKEGNENRLLVPREWRKEIMELPPLHGELPDLQGYVSGLEEAIRSAHEVARANLKTAQLRSKRAYDLRVVAHQYNKGGVVYKLDTVSVSGMYKKLSPMWRGPGVILERISPYLYKGVPVMSSDEDNVEGSPKRSWAAEEKKGEGTPFERHQDMGSSVDSTLDPGESQKGQEGETRVTSEVPGKATSGDNRDPSTESEGVSETWGSGAVGWSPRDMSPNSRGRVRSGTRDGPVRDPSGGRGRCSDPRSTPVGIPADWDAHSAPPLGRGLRRKETTQERKRRRQKQADRLREETARLERALRRAHEQQGPQPERRSQVGVLKQATHMVQGERRLGCPSRGHPNTPA
ncbi:unnamed protein product [Mytilus coruscus]|uniref:Uncharacterized protein n=1 Tax=Mytilus coruscus TaxID=42192 RepID=A0A6J8APW8_MYTCO|nr:unnamed protein product [Mytilus coruscus]